MSSPASEYLAPGDDDDVAWAGDELLLADRERGGALEHVVDPRRAVRVQRPVRPFEPDAGEAEPGLVLGPQQGAHRQVVLGRLDLRLRRGGDQHQTMPPSTGSSAPVIPDERSLARNSAARATSSSVAIRPSAVPAAGRRAPARRVGRRPPPGARAARETRREDWSRRERVDADPVAAERRARPCGGGRAPHASTPCRPAGSERCARRSSRPSRRSRRHVLSARGAVLQRRSDTRTFIASVRSSCVEVELGPCRSRAARRRRSRRRRPGGRIGRRCGARRRATSPPPGHVGGDETPAFGRGPSSRSTTAPAAPAPRTRGRSRRRARGCRL